MSQLSASHFFLCFLTVFMFVPNASFTSLVNIIHTIYYYIGDHMCIGRDHQDDRGWPGWRRCRTTSTPTGCHGPTQSTWPRTDNSGGCWQPVALCTRSGASRRRRRRRRPAWWKDFLLVACHCIVIILFWRINLLVCLLWEKTETGVVTTQKHLTSSSSLLVTCRHIR